MPDKTANIFLLAFTNTQRNYEFICVLTDDYFGFLLIGIFLCVLLRCWLACFMVLILLLPPLHQNLPIEIVAVFDNALSKDILLFFESATIHFPTFCSQGLTVVKIR